MQSRIKLQIRALIPWSIFLGLGIYLLIFGFNSLTRTRIFTPDGMNYVNVARSVTQGTGLMQPTLGFNQPRFAAQDHIPTPFVAQPPVYPLLIALCSLSRVSCADCALLIGIVCYGGILGMSFVVAARLYDARVGYVTVGLLLLYYPIHSVAEKACSEPVGILFVLLSIWLLVRSMGISNNSLLLVGAGVIAGLAFATRYLFAPIYCVGLLWLCSGSALWRKRLSSLGLYTLGFAIPACIVLGRNYLLIHTIMPPLNPSQIGLKSNVVAAAQNLFGMYADMQPSNQFSSRQFVFMILLLLFLCFVLLVQKRFEAGLQNVFLKNSRFLLMAWTGGYLGFLILERSHFHFDSISPRLIAPAGVTAVLLCAALVVEAANAKAVYLQAGLVAILCLCIGREAKITTRTPPYRAEQTIFQSERLHWIAAHTTRHDLIIGDDTMDVPFYLPDRNTVSFSPYPYTDYASYQRVMVFCQAQSRNYDHVYLILRHDSKTESEWRQNYGPFFTDLLFGNRHSYPDIVFNCSLQDAYIFEIQCHTARPMN